MDETQSRAGTRFGPYELRALLGRGGMGEVYEAYDTVKDRVVAVKLLPMALADDPRFQQRFRHESRVAARLAEPHVIPIHDWGEIDGVLYIDMRLVRGSDLRSVLRDKGPLSPTRAVGIIEQVAAALDAAHAEGLVHRDVKPANILVTPSDFAYLADFGIARSERDPSVTATGQAIGSYSYIAPERFDTAPIGGTADVYSLACVLFECLTGAQPFPADGMSSLIRAHLSTPPPRPTTKRAGLPGALDEVISRGMAKEPADRYPTARALASAARAAVSGTSSVPNSDLPTAEISNPQPAPATIIFPTFGPQSTIDRQPPNWPQQSAGSQSAVGPQQSGGSQQSGGPPRASDSQQSGGPQSVGGSLRAGGSQWAGGSQSTSGPQSPGGSQLAGGSQTSGPASATGLQSGGSQSVSGLQQSGGPQQSGDPRQSGGPWQADGLAPESGPQRAGGTPSASDGPPMAGGLPSASGPRSTGGPRRTGGQPQGSGSQQSTRPQSHIGPHSASGPQQITGLEPTYVPRHSSDPMRSEIPPHDATTEALSRTVGMPMPQSDAPYPPDPTPIPARRSMRIVWICAVLVILAIGGIIGWQVHNASRHFGQPATTTMPAHLPAGAKPCAQLYPALGRFTSSAIGTTVTSCAFAEEVRKAYANGGDSTITDRSVMAHSPINNRDYKMNCTAGDQFATCSGGENAIVYVY
ncbi:protein kinase [Nocardia sp. NPDC052278]|uniref:protein kinase domain-containing protein n=1 Tax=unclassified Nocardia TaxID=2637762 RepID=UPI00368072AF